MNVDTANAMNRRTLLTAGTASLFSLGTIGKISAKSQLLTESTSSQSATYQAKDDLFIVEWDADLWKINTEGEGNVQLWSIEQNQHFDLGYSLGINYQDIPWGAPEHDLQDAIDSWFTQGMLTSVIVHTWEENEEMGFIFTSGGVDNRTVILFAYRPINGEPERRLQTTLTIDQEIFERTKVTEMLEGVSINGETLTTTIEVRDLVDILESNLD